MKKIAYTVSGILILGFIWYFFIKSYDYTIRFTANTFPGTINQTLKQWDTRMDAKIEIEQNGSIYNLTQHISFNDSTLRYQWYIKPLTDSTSRVQVNVKDVKHSFMNKIKVPFSDTDFEKRSRKTVREFMKALNDHITRFKVKVIGRDSIQSKYCAYVTVKTKQEEKAFGMMRDFPRLVSFLKENNIQENGLPFVEVTHWDQQRDSISYNFCYPIVYHDSLPTHQEIKYKKNKLVNGLKAIYNGNYITSNRAWYALLDYARANTIEVVPTPIEYFYNNPNQGGDELRWKAEIFLPIKEKAIE